MLMVAIVIVFIIRIWVPSNESISKVKTNLKKLQVELGMLESALKTSAAAPAPTPKGVKPYETYEEWANKLAASPEVFLMKAFSEPSMQRGISMPEISFEPTKDDGGVITKPFKIILKGSFLAANGYLKRMYDLPLLLVVDSIDIKLDNEASGDVTTEIKGVAYGW